jgi:alcohol dehydrogenase, propanol-preferring
MSDTRANKVPTHHRAVQITGDCAAAVSQLAVPTLLPGSGALLVRVIAAGICHSDVHLYQGGYDIGDNRNCNSGDDGTDDKDQDNKSLWRFDERGLGFPVTPGHEMVGEVIQVADSDTHTDDEEQSPSKLLHKPVAVFPWIGCGDCRRCKLGHDNICEGKTREIGFGPNGGYSSYIVVPHQRYVVELQLNATLQQENKYAVATPISNCEFEQRWLPHKEHLCAAATLSCAGLTSFNAVSFVPEERAHSQVVAVIGCGGVGMICIQLLRLLRPWSSVVALDIDSARLEEAKAHGATHCINTKEHGASQIRSKIAELCATIDGAGSGCDAVLDFVNIPQTASPIPSLLCKGGKWIMVGLHGGSMPLQLPVVPLRAFDVHGVHVGNVPQFKQLVDLFNSGTFIPAFSNTCQLDDAIQVLAGIHQTPEKFAGRHIIWCPM